VANTFTKLLVFVHRWLGIVLCLFFTMWFFSGIVMMYVAFPSLSEMDRLGFLEPINTAVMEVEPYQALGLCGKDQINELRVISLETRPVYVCENDTDGLRTVYADVLSRATLLSKERVIAIADAALGTPSVPSVPFVVDGPMEYDQWIVHEKFDLYRPFYRVEVDDPASTHLYISAQTGEFLQRTSAQQRFWNYLGAVVHWIYPTVLRKHWVLWDQVVWWLSLFGIVGATIGVYLGVWHLLKIRRSGQKLLSPFRSWMKWHHLVGLFSGLFVVSWIFSGWLSMDHGRLFSESTPTIEHAKSVRGLTMSEIAAKVSVKELSTYRNTREITLHAFGGAEIIVAKNEGGLVDTPGLHPKEISRVIGAAWSGSTIFHTSVVQPLDTYTHLREGQLPGGTVRVELADTASTWIHVDVHSGEILSLVDRSRRLYRWLFNGLHSLDIPGLVERRPLWDLVMLLLLSSGLLASVTGVVVGSKRLIRTLTR
jgi:hypothetical protein